MKSVLAGLATLAAISAVNAGTLINTFDADFDYVANGILGDPNWDGVYMRFGDIPNGSPGDFGNGQTLIANTLDFPDALALQTVGGDWSGNANDGFFLYKVVEGDFDVSVQNLPAQYAGFAPLFDNRAFNFAGLMVRAYHTNNSGAPFSTTTTNVAENFMTAWRFNEFGIDSQVRVSTNGANFEYNRLGSNDATNTSRFYRITRVGNVFTFYVKTNLADPWAQMTVAEADSITREDWDGIPLQVGIVHAPFQAESRDAFFDDFELSGPNVNVPVMPTAPSNLITTATNVSGSLTFSWTKGSPENNSLVVMSQRPIQHNPVHGRTYTANANYGSADSLIGGAGHYVVYNGPGNSVTVNNLGANNLTYYVAVFDYSGTGPASVYNTESPAVLVVPGPGVITGATIVAGTDTIPVNGALKLKLIATFSTGETSDQTDATTWLSMNPGVADVDIFGTVNARSVGSAQIMATFGPHTPSVTINVHGAISFTDTFDVSHDYRQNGVLGTGWDGVFLNFGDVPGATAGGDGEGETVVMDAQITDTNGLYLSSVLSTWNNLANDGPFLFKVVPGSTAGLSGDFQAVLHIDSMNTLNGVVAGLMARVYNPADHGPAPGGVEHHVEFWKVQNGTTSVRRTQDQPGNNTTTIANGTAANWLLMTRENSTNFFFFEKENEEDPWIFVAEVVLEGAANNAPMEVGIAQQSTTGVNGIAVFDHFALTAAGVDGNAVGPSDVNDLSIKLEGLSMKIEYTVGTNLDGTALGSVVVMRAGAPVTAKPYDGQSLTGNPVFGQGTSLAGGNYVVHVVPSGGSQTNHSVTVSGLTPGVVYYAAVFTFRGDGATAVYSGGVGGQLAAGMLESISATLEGNGIPHGGIGRLLVQAHYTGGTAIDVSNEAEVFSTDTNVVKVFGRVLTGIAKGTADVLAVYEGLTNAASVTVRDPSFVDDFDVSHDYLSGSVAGTGWDGLYDPGEAKGNPIPDSPYVPLVGSGATVANANITSNGLLVVTSQGDGWENANAGGWFLFKYVPGDFQAAVKIDFLEVAMYNQPGILARAYGIGGNGVPGAPFGTVVSGNQGEYWVSLTRFDEFGIGTYTRRNLNSGPVTQSTQPDLGDGNYWLLIVRSHGTNFTFYKRLLETDPWRPVPNNTMYNIAQFANAPMQVGVMAGPWFNEQRTVSFDRFMLDIGSGSALRVATADGNLILSWPAVPGAVLQSTESLSPAEWEDVPGTPTLGADGYSLTVPIGTGTRFYRLKQ